MKAEKFNQLQTIFTLYGLCYSLDYMIDELADYELPEEIAKKTKNVRKALDSFRKTVSEYILAHKDDYIDKEED